MRVSLSQSESALVLERKPISILWCFATVAVFGFGYLTFVANYGLRSQVAFLAGGAFLSGYSWFFSSWVDRARIDKMLGQISATYGLQPFAKERSFPIARAKFVTVADVGNYVYIVFVRDQGSLNDAFRVIGGARMAEAWQLTVEIATYLQLPIHDGRFGEYVWTCGHFPKTWQERKLRINSIQAAKV